MKRKFLNQIIAVGATAAMVAGLAGCGSTGDTPATPAPENPETQTPVEGGEGEPAGDESPYEVITDADGNPVDLGGVEVDIVEWWAADLNYPENDYNDAKEAYLDWAQETYNFTVKEIALADWGQTPEEYANYVMAGGDDHYYVYATRWCAATSSALAEGLMYDLATLDCLDFDHDSIFTRNKIDETFSKGSSIYAMYGANNGFAEPRYGMYFNKRVLQDAGIDPESIYDMQADGTWTWDAWEELLKTVQRDLDNDGTIDVWGFCGNNGDFVTDMIFSNGGSVIALTDDGKFRVALEDANVQESLTRCQYFYDTYDAHASYPADANWDYYKTDWLTGNTAFYPGSEWEVNNVTNMDDEVGFVSFPVGPSAGSNYKTYAEDNLYVIPSCYDADKAWKCAFAYKIFFGDVPGYEDYVESMSALLTGYYSLFDDTRAVDESIVRISRTSAYEVAGTVPQIDWGPDFLYKVGIGQDMSAIVEGTMAQWETFIDEANAKR